MDNSVSLSAMEAELKPKVLDTFDRIGWSPIERHDREMARRLRSGLDAIAGVRQKSVHHQFFVFTRQGSMQYMRGP